MPRLFVILLRTSAGPLATPAPPSTCRSPSLFFSSCPFWRKCVCQAFSMLFSLPFQTVMFKPSPCPIPLGRIRSFVIFLEKKSSLMRDDNCLNLSPLTVSFPTWTLDIPAVFTPSHFLHLIIVYSNCSKFAPFFSTSTFMTVHNLQDTQTPLPLYALPVHPFVSPLLSLQNGVFC